MAQGWVRNALDRSEGLGAQQASGGISRFSLSVSLLLTELTKTSPSCTKSLSSHLQYP